MLWGRWQYSHLGWELPDGDQIRTTQHGETSIKPARNHPKIGNYTGMCRFLSGALKPFQNTKWALGNFVVRGPLGHLGSPAPSWETAGDWVGNHCHEPIVMVNSDLKGLKSWNNNKLPFISRFIGSDPFWKLEANPTHERIKAKHIFQTPVLCLHNNRVWVVGWFHYPESWWIQPTARYHSFQGNPHE